MLASGAGPQLQDACLLLLGLALDQEFLLPLRRDICLRRPGLAARLLDKERA